MQVSLRIKTDTLTADLKSKIRKLENPEEALRAVGEEVVAMAKGAFSDPGLRPEPWAPLKPATLARKAKKKYGSEPLVASGALARSPRVIRTESAGANDKAVIVGSDRRAQGESLASGSRLAKGMSLSKLYGMTSGYSLAGIHQLGAPKANIPARPFFPFTSAGEATAMAKQRIKEILMRWFKP